MAVTPDKVQIGTSADYLDGVAVDTPAGTGLFRETVVAADPENGDALARVRNAQPTDDDYGSVVRVVGKQYPYQGTTTYFGGSSGTVAIPSGARVVSLSAHALTPGTITIFGGQSIPVPAANGFATGFDGFVGPGNIVFTGTDSYYVAVNQ